MWWGAPTYLRRLPVCKAGGGGGERPRAGTFWRIGWDPPPLGSPCSRRRGRLVRRSNTVTDDWQPLQQATERDGEGGGGGGGRSSDHAMAAGTRGSLCVPWQCGWALRADLLPQLRLREPPVSRSPGTATNGGGGGRPRGGRLWVAMPVILPCIRRLHAACFDCRLAGHSVLTGSGDTTICAWDLRRLGGAAAGGRHGVAASSRLFTLRGHTDSVWCVAADGRKVVSGSVDTTIKCWDTKTRSCRHTLRGHIEPVLCCAFDDERDTPFLARSHSSLPARVGTQPMMTTVSVWLSARLVRDHLWVCRLAGCTVGSPLTDRLRILRELAADSPFRNWCGAYSCPGLSLSIYLSLLDIVGRVLPTLRTTGVALDLAATTAPRYRGLGAVGCPIGGLAPMA